MGHAMGEDDEKRGDMEKALAKFTEAHRVTATWLARDPGNPERMLGHAQILTRVVSVPSTRHTWRSRP